MFLVEKKCRVWKNFYEEYKDSGLEVIGVSVDNFGMDDRIKLFTERMNVTYPIWHDPKDAFTRTFKAIGVPESYLIDKNGTIYHQWKGQFNPTAESTKSIVENALLQVFPAFASTNNPSSLSTFYIRELIQISDPSTRKGVILQQ